MEGALETFQDLKQQQMELDDDLCSILQTIQSQDANGMKKLVTRMHWLREEQREISKEKSKLTQLKEDEKKIIDNFIQKMEHEQEAIDLQAKKAVEKNLINSNEEKGTILKDAHWQINPKLLREDTLIGHGMFGKVFKADYSGTTVALKKLHLDFVHNKNAQEDFKREIKILATLRHPNLLLFMGACTDDQNLMMITEFMEKGSLADHIRSKDQKKILTIKRKFLIAKGTAQGLSCLHNYGLLHLDLKPGNILLDGNCVPKIADFGLSIFQKDEHSSEVGSPFYMSPEVWNGNNYNQSADVYSFGIVLWELFTEREPYDKAYSTIPDLKHAVCQTHIRPHLPIPALSSNFNTWLPLTWTFNPALRISIEDLMKEKPHVWDEWNIESLLYEDVKAQMIWKARFLGDWVCEWRQFKSAVRKISRPHSNSGNNINNVNNINNTSMYSSLGSNPDDLIPWLCFKEFLQPQNKLSIDDHVTIEQFSALLKTIGPFDAGIVDRAHDLVKQFYFCGQMTATESVNVLNTPYSFLVRFSSNTPGIFTLSKVDGSSIQHFRIQYNPGEGYFLGKDSNKSTISKFKTLTLLIEDGVNNPNNPLYPLKVPQVPLKGYRYSVIENFVKEKFSNVGRYMTDNENDID